MSPFAAMLLAALLAAPVPSERAVLEPLRFMAAHDRDRFERLWARAGLAPRAAEVTEVSPVEPPAIPFAPLPAFALSTNVRVNDPTGDRTNETQTESAAAALGPRILVAWNDSKGFNSFGATNTLAGWGYSADGGATWIDGGDFPRHAPGSGEQLFGDPSLAMNRNGNCWFGSIYVTPGNQQAVAVLRGSFTGATPVWNPPVAVSESATDFQDKPLVACDLDHDWVYVTYGRYLPGSSEGQVEIARSLDGGVTFDPAVVIQPLIPGDWLATQCPLVDEQGNVHVFWMDGSNRALGVEPPSFILHRRSSDQAATFAPTDTAAIVHGNPYTCPPGSNRAANYVQCIAVAADLSQGPYRGTLYVAWEESAIPVFSGVSGTTAEAEPNGTVAQAMPIAAPLRINGTIASAADVDFYSFQGAAGQMVRLSLTPSAALNAFVELSNAPAGDTTLAHSGYGQGQVARAWVTLPSTATYTARVAAFGTTGSYALDVESVTPAAGSVGRDHRDIALAWSRDRGTTWSAPVILNDDLPYFDESLPMLAVDTLGVVHAFWSDRRNDALRGGRADTYYCRSTDGGATWSPNRRITDQTVTWQVPSRGSPSFGDYCTAVATGADVFPFWTDGRFASPDVFTAVVRSGFLLACPGDATLAPGDTLEASYVVTNRSPFADTFRYSIADSLGVFSAADDSVVIAAASDATIAFQRVVPPNPGAAYDDPLRLDGFFRSAAWAGGTCRTSVHVGSGTVAVAERPAAGTHFDPPAPNPFTRTLALRFQLDRAGRVRLAAYDVAGRRVARLAEGPRTAGPHAIEWDGRGDDGEPVPRGIYFLRADLDGRTIIRRIVRLGP